MDVPRTGNHRRNRAPAAPGSARELAPPSKSASDYFADGTACATSRAGLMWGVELHDARKPAPRSKPRCGGSHRAADRPKRKRHLDHAPLVIEREELDRALDILDSAIAETGGHLERNLSRRHRRRRLRCEGASSGPARASAFDVVALASPHSAQAVAQPRDSARVHVLRRHGCRLRTRRSRRRLAAVRARRRRAGALAAGKHVLCEKPFALNVAQAQRMLDASTAARTACGVSHEFAGFPSAWHQGTRRQRPSRPVARDRVHASHARPA